MMVLALSILVGTSLMLEQSRMEVAALKSEVSSMQAQEVTDVQTPVYSSVTAECTFDGEDSVDVYPVEDQPLVMSELLSAFASLWKS
jgi:hypothetical protein